jgi:hypothetical protein
LLGIHMAHRTRKTTVFVLILSLLSAAGGGIAASAPMGSDRPRFNIPEEGCLLDIDLDALTMTVYRDGEVYRSYPVSGGTLETPSPVGTWHVSEISDWGEWFGGSWIGLDVPWGIYGIHGTRKPWLVGKQLASHGCIRMRDQDAEEVKKLVSIGTVVHIKHDALPFRSMGTGSTGSDVYNTQKMLQNLGFYTGAVDGIFGEGMKRAVKSFQKTYSLKKDGVVGRDTYDKIVEQNRIKTQMS